MIDLDKTVFLNIPLYNDPLDTRVDTWCAYWASRPGLDALDTIRVTESELNGLVGTLSNTKHRGSDLVEKPALKEFELVVAEAFPATEKTVVRFKRPFFPKRRSR